MSDSTELEETTAMINDDDWMEFENLMTGSYIIVLKSRVVAIAPVGEGDYGCHVMMEGGHTIETSASCKHIREMMQFDRGPLLPGEGGFIMGPFGAQQAKGGQADG